MNNDIIKEINKEMIEKLKLKETREKECLKIKEEINILDKELTKLSMKRAIIKKNTPPPLPPRNKI